MTIVEAQAQASIAGRNHAVSQGRPPVPWTREDFDAANAEFRRLCREHKIDAFVLPSGKK